MEMPTMLTIAQAVAETGLTYNCVRKMCLDNRIVYVKSGKKFLINREKFIEYLNGDKK